MHKEGTPLPQGRTVDVSVVVSTFNRAAPLRRTLESLVSQSVPADLRYEVLVVDNGCTDGTRALVAEFVRAWPDRVRYVSEPRRGVSFGRNAGITAARAPLVAFTDDDNVVTRTWVADIRQLMRDHPDAAGVGGRVLPEWPATPPAWLDRRHWSPLAILDYGERTFRTSASRPMCLLTANLALRRDALAGVGGFSPAFPRCQDHELLLRLWRAGEHVIYAPRLVVFAAIEPERLTRRYHRRWHARHGYYAAAMRLEEATDPGGQLRRTPQETVRLFGTPGYVYADAARHLLAWAGARVRGRRARAAHHEHRWRYLLAYLRRCATLTRAERPWAGADIAAFAHTHARRRARLLDMPLRRLAVAHMLVALLVGGSAWDVVTGLEHWPLSPYPMFSRVEREPTLDSLIVAGVPRETGAPEMALRDLQYIGPFDQCRLVTAFQRVKGGRDSGTRMRAMLRDALARYEAAREAGAHDGPALRAIRLYAAHWRLAPDAANVDRPEVRQLLGEVTLAGMW